MSDRGIDKSELQKSPTSSDNVTWHIITSEYPPQVGGVSDYSYLIATELAAAGETVHVWCPSADVSQTNPGSVIVHRELARFSPGELRQVGRMLDMFPAPRRLFVQWVPHGFGFRSLNLPFCFWLWKRSKSRKDLIEIMVHEPFLAFGEASLKQDLAAAVHRIMIVTLLRAASRIWVSIPEWETRLRPFALGANKSFRWLPVPSNVPVVDDPPAVTKLRARYALREGSLIGHFGAYDDYMTELMLELVPLLLAPSDNLSILFLGKGSHKLYNRLVDQCPDLGPYLHATGVLASEDVSRHISACDVMLQPYEDGVSGRRGSVMAALSHGAAVVTTLGKATESCWVESKAVKLAKVGDLSAIVEAAKSLLADATERRRLSVAGRLLYDERFDVKRTIRALREAVA